MFTSALVKTLPQVPQRHWSFEMAAFDSVGTVCQILESSTPHAGQIISETATPEVQWCG
jgi:hypothetical protein